MSTPLPLVYLSIEHTLYLGTFKFPLRELASTAAQLLVCLEGELKVINQDNAESVVSRSFHLDAGERVKIDCRDAIFAVCFLDVLQRDADNIKLVMEKHRSGVYVNHRDEDFIIDTFKQILHERPSYSESQAILNDIVVPQDIKRQGLFSIDPRLVHVTNRIRDTIHDNVSVGELAEEVHLSESRLVKLFKDQIGIPIRKYRLWLRLHFSVAHLVAGASFTDAALAAGFSNIAHFSRTYSAMLGLSPSLVFTDPPRVDIVLPDGYEMLTRRLCTLPNKILNQSYTYPSN